MTDSILDQAAEVLRNSTVPPCPPPELVAATLAAIANRHPATVPSQLARQQRRSRIMRYIGFGTVIATAMAVATAGVLFLGGTQAVALDNVLDKIKQAESATFVVNEKLCDQSEQEQTFAFKGHLVRMQGAGMTIVLDTKEKVGLVLMPLAKTYVKIDKNSPNPSHGGAWQSPFVDLLSSMDWKSESFVGEKLDGKAVQKLTIKSGTKADSPHYWVIWVDPKTEMPVRMCFYNMTRIGDRVMPGVKTYSQFEWNARLDDKLFRFDIPEGYSEGKLGLEALPGVAWPPR